MANTCTSLFYHLVFSTKNREPWLVPSIERRIWNYLGGVARVHKIIPLQIGGVEDHIHGPLPNLQIFLSSWPFLSPKPISPRER